MDSILSFESYKPIRDQKGKSILDFPSTYCVIDLETTGHSPLEDEIIEIGAIKYVDRVKVGEFQSLVRPGVERDIKYIDDFIEQLTGITNEMIWNAPETIDVLPRFAEFIGDCDLLGYFVSFDINFLYDNFISCLNIPLKNNHIDILRMARRLYPQLTHHRLMDMVSHLKLDIEGSHRSIFDCRATQLCYDKFREEAIKQYGSEDNFLELGFKKRNNKLHASSIVGDDSQHDPDNYLYGRYCVFTGQLERMNRKEAMQIVANIGGINEDLVTKKTNYLIMGNFDYVKNIKGGKTSKYKKAEEYKIKGQDIEVIPEQVFYDLICDNVVS